MTVETLQAVRFPLHHSRLIEASAGTGKTYTIAALYLRLILNHGAVGENFGRPLQPSELLVVTFTEAATEELRDRIRARLSEAARWFRGDITEADEFLQQLSADYPDQQWPLLAQQLDAAAQAMDEAAIHTIHGWCNRMLREHAFASGSLFTQQLNTDSNQQWLSLARDYWRNHLQLLAADQCLNYQRLSDLLHNPQTLYQKIRPLLSGAAIASSTRQPPASPQQLLSGYQQAEQQLRNEHHNLPWLAWLDAAWEALQQHWLTKNLDGRIFKRSSGEIWFAQLRHWATQLNQADTQLLPPLSTAAFARLSHDGLVAALKQPDQAVGLLQQRLWQGLADLQQAVTQLPDYRIGVLEHAANWLQQRFAALQVQRAQIGFDDMLTRLHQALQSRHGGRLAELIRNQFAVAMIDEFQDTDPTQYAIFNAIYRLAEPYPNTGIFLIGDPKQAIYSFRNADIYTYLQARNDTSPRHYTLAVNYRSTAAMVAATNSLFLSANNYAAGAFLFKHKHHDPVPFVEVAAHGLNQTWQLAGQPGPALQWFVNSDTKANKDILLEQLAEHCAEQMALLLNTTDTGFVDVSAKLQRVQPGDMAVLVNSGSEARVIRAALRKRQIPSVYLSDRDSVFAGSLARDLLIVLRACASPGDPQLLRAALATELMHLSLAELERLKQDERSWDQHADQFVYYHQCWQRQGVLAMLQRLFHDFALPARLLANADQGERWLTDALHLAELLQQQMRQVEGMAGLLRYLDEHIEACKSDGNRTDSEAQQVRLESDSKLVQVITIHKSKGLQYPLVFLPFISYCQGSDYRLRLPARYHDEQGQLRLVFSKDDRVAYEKADRERLAEDLRKLYVAVTRAQYATFIGLSYFKEWSASALSYLAGGQINDKNSDLQQLLLLTQAPTQEVMKITALQHYDDYVGAKAMVKHCCEMPAEHAFEPWWVSSYSALTYRNGSSNALAMDDADSANLLEEQHSLPVTVAAEATTAAAYPAPNTIHSFAKGAEPGTLLHNLLEAAALKGFGRVAGDPDLQQQLLVQACAAPKWQVYIPILQRWFDDFLSVPFTLPAGQARVSLSQLTSYQAEPEFWFVVNQVDTEVIDQLVTTHVHPGRCRSALQAKQLNGMLKGFIDLLFEYEGRYYVLDYKSNYLGPDTSSYGYQMLRDKILASRYDLQYVIYLVALHKLLQVRLGQLYDYDKHVGGAVYLFIRGYQHQTVGAFCERPPRQLIEQLSALFSGQPEPSNSAMKELC